MSIISNLWEKWEVSGVSANTLANTILSCPQHARILSISFTDTVPAPDNGVNSQRSQGGDKKTGEL